MNPILILSIIFSLQFFQLPQADMSVNSEPQTTEYTLLAQNNKRPSTQNRKRKGTARKGNATRPQGKGRHQQGKGKNTQAKGKKAQSKRQGKAAPAKKYQPKPTHKVLSPDRTKGRIHYPSIS